LGINDISTIHMAILRNLGLSNLEIFGILNGNIAVAKVNADKNHVGALHLGVHGKPGLRHGSG